MFEAFLNEEELRTFHHTEKSVNQSYLVKSYMLYSAKLRIQKTKTMHDTDDALWAVGLYAVSL